MRAGSGVRPAAPEGSAPLPPYIERLIAHNKARGKTGADEHPLFEAKATPGKKGAPPKAADDDPVPDVEITAAEYRKTGCLRRRVTPELLGHRRGGVPLGPASHMVASLTDPPGAACT